MHDGPADEAPRDDDEPYYAEDTRGVHFPSWVDGRRVQAYVSRAVLALRYGLDTGAPSEVASLQLYRQHQQALHDAVLRRVRRDGPETVILRVDEIPDDGT